MGLDMEKMKKRMMRMNGSSETKNMFWKVPMGESVIRLVSLPDGDFVRDFHLHYGLGRGFLCPKRNYDEECPVCEFASKLFKQGTESKEQEDINMAKKLFAKHRFYSPVLVRGEEELGIRWWSYGKTVYERLMGLVMNPDYGDITHEKQGTDLVITYSKSGGKIFPETTVDPKRLPTSLLEDENEIVSLLDSIPDLMEVLDRKTTQEAKEMLDKHLLEDDTDVFDEKVKKVTQEGKEEVMDVESAIDEMLSE